MTGPITDVSVTLHGVSQTEPNQMRVLLVSPRGTAVSLMDFRCGGEEVAGYTWVFNQQALAEMPSNGPCDGVVCRPSGYAPVAVGERRTSSQARALGSSWARAGETGVISDVNVGIDGIWHQAPDDLDMLLVGPAGQKVVLTASISDSPLASDVSTYRLVVTAVDPAGNRSTSRSRAFRIVT
jgi:hypothetical protein